MPRTLALATMLRLSFGVNVETTSRYILYPFMSRRMVRPPMVFGSPVSAVVFVRTSLQVRFTWLSSAVSVPFPVAVRASGVDGVVVSVTVAHGGEAAGAHWLELPAESFASTCTQYEVPLISPETNPWPR